MRTGDDRLFGWRDAGLAAFGVGLLFGEVLHLPAEIVHAGLQGAAVVVGFGEVGVEFLVGSGEVLAR